ncbi:hypothetical protein [Bosea sp. 2RAB26]|uniref:hypothetical protein n=1 Tax=Bosea sp. 2RAB26 TaxID=3237476 RepID=UPI003F8DFECA
MAFLGSALVFVFALNLFLEEARWRRNSKSLPQIEARVLAIRSARFGAYADLQYEVQNGQGRQSCRAEVRLGPEAWRVRAGRKVGIVTRTDPCAAPIVVKAPAPILGEFLFCLAAFVLLVRQAGKWMLFERKRRDWSNPGVNVS